MTENSKITVHNLDAANERSKSVRRMIFRCLRENLSAIGGDLAGFAIVMWGMRGGTTSSYSTKHGMVSECLMPTLVHDVLNRHVAVTAAQTCESKPISDGPVE